MNLRPSVQLLPLNLTLYLSAGIGPSKGNTRTWERSSYRPGPVRSRTGLRIRSSCRIRLIGAQALAERAPPAPRPRVRSPAQALARSSPPPSPAPGCCTSGSRPRPRPPGPGSCRSGRRPRPPGAAPLLHDRSARAESSTRPGSPSQALAQSDAGRGPRPWLGADARSGPRLLHISEHPDQGPRTGRRRRLTSFQPPRSLPAPPDPVPGSCTYRSTRTRDRARGAAAASHHSSRHAVWPAAATI